MHGSKRLKMGSPLIYLTLLCLSGLSCGARSDMFFTGSLLERPCQLDPTSSEQYVAFPESTLPQFHNVPGRSSSKKFVIKLFNCQATWFGKVVTVVFSGEQDPGVPGALKVTGVNSGKLAIQLIDQDGITPLPLGKIHHASNGDVIAADSFTLNFSAYVTATPKALADRSVEAGDYAAIATFKINYQ